MKAQAVSDRRRAWSVVGWAVALWGCAALAIIGISMGTPRPAYSPSTSQRAWLNPATVFHPDEFAYVGIPFRMLLTDEWDPHYYHNPPLTIYTNLGLFALGGARDLPHDLTHDVRAVAPFQLYVMARAVSGLWTLLTVALTYATGRAIFGRRAGAIGAALVAIAPLTVEHAHFATPNALTTLLATAALLLAAILITGRRMGRTPLWAIYALAGLLVGLTAAARYNAGAVGVVTGLALLVAWRRDRRWRLVAIGLLAMPLGLVLGVPGLLMVPDAVIDQVRDILDWYRARGGGPGFTAGRGLPSLAYHWRYVALVALGPAALLLASGGALVVLRRTRGSASPQARLTLALIVYLLVYSALALVGRRLQANLLFPLIAPLALLAGRGVAAVWGRYGPRVGALAVVALLAWPGLLSGLLVYRLVTPDTRLRAQEWIYAHIPHGTPIYLLGPYNVPLDPLDYAVRQTFAREASAETLRAHPAPIVVYSDAYPWVVLRDRRLSDARAIAREEDIRALLESDYTVLQRFPRRPWPAERLAPDDVSYWFEMAITIYCRPADCPVLVGEGP